MKIIKILKLKTNKHSNYLMTEFYQRIMLNHGNLIIPYENHENYENHKIPNDNNENHANPRISLENHTFFGQHRIPRENYKK